MLRRATWVLAAVLAPGLEAAAQVPLGPEFVVNLLTGGAQFDPAVAMDPSGNFVVTWASYSGPGSLNNVWGRRFAADATPRGVEFMINEFTTNNQYNSRVAVAPNGDFVAVWESFGQGTTQFHVFARRYAANGTPIGSEFRLDPSGQGDQTSPSVSVSPNGDIIAAWDSTGTGFSDREILLERYDAAGALLTAPFVVNSFTNGRQGKPSVAAQPDGGFVVVWESYGVDVSALAIRGRRFDAAAQPMGLEFTVNSYTTGNQAEPAIAVNAFGGFVVAFTSMLQDGPTAGDGPGVFAHQFSNTGVRYPTELRANTYTTGSQGQPSVAVDGTGAFTVVWNSAGEDGDFTGVFARRFFLGIPWPPFQVNTYTTGAQINPAIAAHPHGDFVVVWGSAQDGSGQAVVGRRFGPDLLFYDGFELQN